MDLHARNRRMLSQFSSHTFYGQLLRIFCFTIQASPQIGLLQPETLILAEIQPCKITSKHPNLDIHYFSTYGTPLVFDITCIQCRVGRVGLITGVGTGNSAANINCTWAIIDQSGRLIIPMMEQLRMRRPRPVPSYIG